MVELVARGARPLEAEDIVRRLGARFEQDAGAAAVAQGDRQKARALLWLGVGSIAVGLALLFFLGQAALASGGLIVYGLVMIGRTSERLDEEDNCRRAARWVAHWGLRCPAGARWRSA